MSKRIKKKGTETLVLFRNKHTCCICRDYKNYQDPIIHHIDGNSSNTTESNLAVLCTNHASMADAGLNKGKLGSGRKLSPQEIQMHKKSWEEKVITEFKIVSRVTTIRHKKELELLYEFEISKIKNEILTLQNQREIRNRYDFLTQLSIEEAISDLPLRKIVLKAFNDISVQTAGEKSYSLPLLKALPDLFLHLVGPGEVPIHKEDKYYLMETIKILETLGDYGASISDDREILKKTCQLIIEFVDVAGWYSFDDFIRVAIKAMNKIKKECNGYTNQSPGRTKIEIDGRKTLVDSFLKKAKTSLKRK